MMNHILKQPRVVPPPSPLSERDRIIALVHLARKNLQPYASLDERILECGFQNKKIFGELGGMDGIGAAIKISSFDVGAVESDPASSSLSDAECARFELEGITLIDAISSALLNYSVLNSLLLTICITLTILHTTRSYEIDGPANDHILLAAAAAERGVYADVATYAWPNDAIAQRSLRRVFHWLECAITALATSLCVWSLHQAQGMYALMSTGLPSVAAKCEYVLHNPKELTTVWLCFQQGLNNVHWVMVFYASRCSFVAFACMLASVVVVHLCFGVYSHTPHGVFTTKHKAQHREARLVLARSRAAVPARVVARGDRLGFG